MTIFRSSAHPIFWPEPLEQIKVSQEEKNKLEQIIKQIQIKLATMPRGKIVGSMRSSNCPRRLFVGEKFAFVVLNRHGGMKLFPKEGKQQKQIKYVWDCYSRSFWLKKHVLSCKQINCIKYLINGPNVGDSALGLPKLSEDSVSFKQKKKLRYFEKLAPCSLLEWLSKNRPNLKITFQTICGLMDAVRKIHMVRYHPCAFEVFDASTRSALQFDFPHTLFHGDISPNNIICEGGGKNVRFMLTDFYGIGHLKIAWTPGWGSPETMQFLKTHSYKGLNEEQFCSKYGAKKDTWAMGMLIGSILQGGMHKFFNFYLPCFSFVRKRLDISFNRDTIRLLDSKLANISQKEVDNEIDSLMQKQGNEATKVLWGFVKKYLRVNPDERPTMAECFYDCGPSKDFDPTTLCKGVHTLSNASC